VVQESEHLWTVRDIYGSCVGGDADWYGHLQGWNYIIGGRDPQWCRSGDPHDRHAQHRNPFDHCDIWRRREFHRQYVGGLMQLVSVPADSLKLRALQIMATKTESLSSGAAVAAAVNSAVDEAFTGDGSLATPSENGVHFNLAAEPRAVGGESDGHVR